MPKQKTRKSLAKRMRVTSTGKVVRPKSGRRHLLSNKKKKVKRKSRRKAVLTHADAARNKRAMYY